MLIEQKEQDKKEMKRRSGEIPTAPSTKKYKSRWEVGPNDVENKEVQPKSETVKKRIQIKSETTEKKKILPKSGAQQNTKDYCEQVCIQRTSSFLHTV